MIDNSRSGELFIFYHHMAKELEYRVASADAVVSVSLS